MFLLLGLHVRKNINIFEYYFDNTLAERLTSKNRQILKNETKIWLAPTNAVCAIFPISSTNTACVNIEQLIAVVFFILLPISMDLFVFLVATFNGNR